MPPRRPDRERRRDQLAARQRTSDDAIINRLRNLPQFHADTVRWQLGRMSPALRAKVAKLDAADWRQLAQQQYPGNPFAYHKISAEARREIEERDENELTEEELSTDLGDEFDDLI